MSRPIDPTYNNRPDPGEDPVFVLLGRDLARLRRVRTWRRRSGRRTSPWRRGVRS